MALLCSGQVSCWVMTDVIKDALDVTCKEAVRHGWMMGDYVSKEQQAQSKGGAGNTNVLPGARNTKMIKT